MRDVLAHGKGRERTAVGVDGGEPHLQDPARRLLDRPAELATQAAGRGREQLQRPARTGAERVGVGGRDVETAHQQHEVRI